MKRRVAIVAALEREVKPAVRDWGVSIREHEGRRFKFFESERAVLVCGGIGAQAGRRAAEAIIALYTPETILSVGFAGALDSAFRVGDIIQPRMLIDASDGSRTEMGSGDRVLISFGSIADADQKTRLAKAYGAHAVDMEAAAVARSARLHGLEFGLVKSISDEVNAKLPAIGVFVASDGQLRTAAFVLHAAVRPWLWGSVLRLCTNSSRASRSLCRWLSRYNEPEFLKNNPEELLPIAKIPN